MPKRHVFTRVDGRPLTFSDLEGMEPIDGVELVPPKVRSVINPMTRERVDITLSPRLDLHGSTLVPLTLHDDGTLITKADVDALGEDVQQKLGLVLDRLGLART